MATSGSDDEFMSFSSVTIQELQ